MGAGAKIPGHLNLSTMREFAKNCSFLYRTTRVSLARKPVLIADTMAILPDPFASFPPITGSRRL
jgi:hypothetical protein